MSDGKRPRVTPGAMAWIIPVLVLGAIVLAVGYDRDGSIVAAAPHALEKRVHPPGAGPDCVSCHPSAAPTAPARGGQDAPPLGLQAFALPPEAANAHWWFGCTHCHDLHGGTTNLHLISEVIDTDYLPPEYLLKTGLRTVVFLNHEGLNSYADGDMLYDGVCEVCHTKTRYHRGDPSGDHSHFPGAKCTSCHDHANYFQPTGITNHPQAATDCSICHRSAAGEPDLLGVHAYRCQSCHPSGFGGTILGPLGTWQHQCTECHNPTVAATGNLEIPTKGHRCVVCHGRQLSTSNPRDMHEEHADKANCVVCHGVIPAVGTAIGSGNRVICSVCHAPSKYAQVPHREFHEKHASKGLSCLECHGGVRPAVDVVTGPAVGTSTNVCQVCHSGRSPSEFRRDRAKLHKKHIDEAMDCGACHMAAILQDDRNPMPALDDPVRARLIRAGYGECRFCHGSGESGSSRRVHEKHVAKQSQWCYNCHEGTDQRPAGLVPPVTRPVEACRLCHDSKSYSASTPFSVHEKHAGKDVKCYTCHQLTPLLSGWPAAWMAPGASSSASSGSGSWWGGRSGR